jgi:hypothetical protein
LLAGGRELALVNLLTSTGADVATITDCEIPEGIGGVQRGRLHHILTTSKRRRQNTSYRAREKRPCLQGRREGHTRHHWPGSPVGLVALQTPQNRQLHPGHHHGRLFSWGGIYREWTPLLSREESKLRLGSLLTQISKAAEHGSRVGIHGDFNVDLDRGEDKGYYMAKLAELLAQCMSAAGLEAHITPPTFRSFGNFVPHLAGDLSRPSGDVASPTGGGPSPAGGGTSPAGGGTSPAGGGPSPAGDGQSPAGMHGWTTCTQGGSFLSQM